MKEKYCAGKEPLCADNNEVGIFQLKHNSKLKKKKCGIQKCLAISIISSVLQFAIHVREPLHILMVFFHPSSVNIFISAKNRQESQEVDTEKKNKRETILMFMK